MKIRIGDTVEPIRYDMGVESEPLILSKPGFDGRDYPVGKMMLPDNAVALERAKVDRLVWWKIKTNKGIEGWVMQAEICRKDWYVDRRKVIKNGKSFK